MSNITPEVIRNIEDAASSIISAGNPNPTNAQILEHLGGGNISVISPVMRAFRSRRRALDSEQSTGLPPELAQLLSTQMGLLWKAAAKQADAIAVKEQAEEDIYQAELDLVLADNERALALVQIEKLKNELAYAMTEKERAVAESNSYKEEKAELTIRISTMQKTLSNLCHIEEEKNMLQLQSQELRDQILSLQNQIEDLKAQGQGQQIEMSIIKDNNELLGSANPGWPSTF